MAGVVADLELNADPALAAVESLSSSLDEAATGLQDSLSNLTATVAVDADTASAETSIEGLGDAPPVDVPVDADTASAESSIASLDDSVPPVEVVVDADTTQAVGEIENLAGASGEASSAMSDASGSADALGSAAAGAGGSAGALAGALQKIGGGGVAAVLAAVGAATAVFFNEAVSAQAATERFNSALGSMAGSVNQINVGNLNMSLSELALTLGSDDDALRQAAASFAQLGQSAGAPAAEVAKVTEELVALSARAVALNPALGSVAEVTDKMGMALTRGGKFAAKFNIDLTSAEISAKALAMTGKTVATELTFYEKAAAGAALATEKYGASLKGDIQSGAQNIQIVIARLKQTFEELVEAIGAPLVAPIIDSMQALVPVAGSVAQVLGSLIQGTLPVFVALLEGLSPVIQVVADALLQIPPPLLAAALAFVKFRSPIAVLLVVLAQVSPDMLKVGAAIAGVVVVILAAVKAWQALKVAMATNPIGVVLLAVGALATAMGLAGDATKGLSVDFQELGKESDRALAKMASQLKLLMEIDFAGSPLVKQKDVLRELREGFDDNFGAAKRFGEALVAAGVITETQYNKALQNARKEHQQLTATQKEGEDALKGWKGTITENLTALAQVSAAIPTLSQEISTFASEWKTAWGDTPIAVDALVQSLTDNTAKIGAWWDGILSLSKQGMDGLALVVANAGPDMGTQLLASIANLSTGVAQELDRMVIQAELRKSAIKAVMESYAPDMVAAFKKGGFAGLETEIQNIMNRIPTAIAGTTPGGQAAMTAAGQADVDAFLTSFATLSPAAQAEVVAAGAAAAASGTAQAPQFHTTGTGWGTRLGTGIDEGGKSAPAAAGRAAANAAAEGTRHTGKMHEAGVALARGFANGLTAGATGVSQAAAQLAAFGAGGLRTQLSGFTGGGTALGQAFVGALRAMAGAASAAGTAIAQAGAQGTRNSGLFAEAGKALGKAFADALRGTSGLAAGAGGAIVAAGAGGTRNTGAFAAAGSATGQAYASALAATAGAAEAAGRAVAQAGARGLASGGSPTVHLWTDAAKLHAEAYADGLAASTGMVMKSARSLVGAGAGSLGGVSSAFGAAAGGGGSSGVNIDTIKVEVLGPVDRANAHTVGTGIADGIFDGLTRRKIVLAGRG